MFGKITLAAGLMALGIVAGSPISSAGPVAATPLLATDAGAVQQVQWRGEGWRWRQCRYWRRECAERWGWGTPRFYRCLWRHDCGRG
jgi:hypothetical protein